MKKTILAICSMYCLSVFAATPEETWAKMQAAHQAMEPATAENALACLADHSCQVVDLPLLYKRDSGLRSTLLARLKESGVRKPTWIPDGAATSLAAISIDGQDFLLGSFSEAHAATNQIDFLYQPKQSALVGLRVVEASSAPYQRGTWLGAPTPAQKKALMNLADPQ